MTADKSPDLLGCGESQPTPVPKPADEFPVVDGQAPKSGFGHSNVRFRKEIVDFGQQIRLGHVEHFNGLLPTRQWAIAQVTRPALVGNVPSMELGWRDRLRDAMSKKGFNMKSLSKAARLGDTYVRDILVRDREPSLSNAQRLCATLDIPVTKIFGNEWDGAEDDAAEPETALPAPAVEGFIPVGRFDASFSMGPGSLITDDPEPLGYWIFEEQWLRALSTVAPNSLAVVKVDGDSMSPTLFGGDLVLIDRSKTKPNAEGIYAIRVGDIAWVKRISINLKSKKVRVLSDNPLVPKQPEMDEEELSIIGRVVALVARKMP